MTTNMNCYVYKWTHLPSMKWYVGSRTRDTSHPDDGYICSSVIVRPMIENRPWEWRREIIATGSKLDMRELEIDILKMFNAAKDDRSFNRSNGNHGFNPKKGKIVSALTRKRLSEANQIRLAREKALGIKRTRTPEQIEAARQGRLGQKVSEEAKRIIGEKNSKNLKGRKRSKESTEKQLATKLKNGTNKPSEETKEKVRQSVIKQWKNKTPQQIAAQVKKTTEKISIPILINDVYYNSIKEAADYYVTIWPLCLGQVKNIITQKLKNDNDINWVKLPKITGSINQNLPKQLNTLEEDLCQMPHIIHLDQEDQLLLMNLLAESFEYKMKKLRRNSSIEAFQNYYIDAIEKIRDNNIPVNHPKRNLFVWLKDNFSFSGDKIWNSRQCQQALEIIDSCCKNSYTRYRLQKTAGQLFNYDHN